MPLLFVDFDKLASGQYGLMDASSIGALGAHAQTLTSKLSPAAADAILKDPDGFDLRPSLLILERWVVLDNLVVDLVALDTSQGGTAVRSFRWEADELLRLDRTKDLQATREEAFVSHVRRELLEKTGEPRLSEVKNLARELSISATLIPFETARRCLDLIVRTSWALQKAHPEVPWKTFGFGLEKRYGETLTEFYGEGAFLARSNFGVERTLFYYEAAGVVGAPLVLHPSRYDEAHAINRACEDAYSAVKQVILRTFEEPIRSELETLGLSYGISLPPLVVRMVRLAGEINMSILDAAKTIKDSPEAKSFREWLSRLQANLTQGTIGGKLRALQLLREVDRITSSWKDELDARHGVTYRRRRLQLSWVPRVGALLALLDGVSVRDPVLNRKGYLTFMSSWYSD